MHEIITFQFLSLYKNVVNVMKRIFILQICYHMSNSDEKASIDRVRKVICIHINEILSYASILHTDHDLGELRTQNDSYACS